MKVASALEGLKICYLYLYVVMALTEFVKENLGQEFVDN